MSNNNSNNNNNNNPAKPNNNPAKPNVMDLEKLKIQYSSQLNAYKQAVSDYVNYIQQNNNTNNTNNTNLVIIQGKTFWGTAQQGVYNDVTVNKCKALCSSTANCSGATYKPDVNGKSMCWLRTGEGTLTPALDTDVAIIPEAQKYLLTIESINKQLIKTNQQIQKIIELSVSVNNSMKTQGQGTNEELLENYNQLLNEREKISELLNSYEVLEQTEKQGEIKVNQNYYSYILLFIIAIGAVIMMYKFLNVDKNTETNTFIQTGGEVSENTSIFLLIIIVIILVVNYYTNIKVTVSTAKDGVSGATSILFSNISSFFSLSDK